MVFDARQIPKELIDIIISLYGNYSLYGLESQKGTSKTLDDIWWKKDYTFRLDLLDMVLEQKELKSEK